MSSSSVLSGLPGVCGVSSVMLPIWCGWQVMLLCSCELAVWSLTDSLLAAPMFYHGDGELVSMTAFLVSLNSGDTSAKPVSVVCCFNCPYTVLSLRPRRWSSVLADNCYCSLPHCGSDLAVVLCSVVHWAQILQRAETTRAAVLCVSDRSWSHSAHAVCLLHCKSAVRVP